MKKWSVIYKVKAKKMYLPIILFIIYLLLDYFNLPSFIGLSSKTINVDLFDAIFNGIIVIVLYIISFFYIDNKQNEKDANSRDVAETLFKKTYQECKQNLEFLDNKIVVEKYIIPKVDGNKTDSENKVVRNLQTLPFDSYDTIMDLATSGYILKNQLEDYLHIKKEYQYLVSIKITFYDLDTAQTADQKSMADDIKRRNKELLALLNKNIEK